MGLVVFFGLFSRVPSLSQTGIIRFSLNLKVFEGSGSCNQDNCFLTQVFVMFKLQCLKISSLLGFTPSLVTLAIGWELRPQPTDVATVDEFSVRVSPLVPRTHYRWSEKGHGMIVRKESLTTSKPALGGAVHV